MKVADLHKMLMMERPSSMPVQIREVASSPQRSKSKNLNVKDMEGVCSCEL